MSGGAQLSVTDLRRASRHSINLPVLAEHRQLGDVMLHIVNISANGFMVREAPALNRGERLTVRLQHVGRIEAFLVWTDGDRAGFQFERIIRPDDFGKMIRSLMPSRAQRGAI